MLSTLSIEYFSFSYNFTHSFLKIEKFSLDVVADFRLQNSVSGMGWQRLVARWRLHARTSCVPIDIYSTRIEIPPDGTKVPDPNR